MSDSLVLTGVKDVRKHTGTEMLRRNPKGGGDTFNVKRWWIAGGVSTCYEPCTVFDVTTAAGTVKLALATKAEGSRVRIDHDGSFNFTFIRPGEISRACLFTESFEVIEHYVFPSISGGKVMVVTPANGADRPTGTPSATLTAVSLSGPATATEGDTKNYTTSKTGTATDVEYVLSSDGTGDSVSGLAVTYGTAATRTLTLTGSSDDASVTGVTNTKSVVVTVPATSIGSVVVSGDATANDSDSLTYTVTADDATASPLAYQWSVTGDAAISAGGSTASATIDFTSDTGTATVTCSVTSTDAGVSDSPSFGNTITVTVS